MNTTTKPREGSIVGANTKCLYNNAVRLIVKHEVKLLSIFVCVSTLCSLSCTSGNTCETTSLSGRYKVLRPVYAVGVFNNAQYKASTPDAVTVYIKARRMYPKRDIAFQHEVPEGTIIQVKCRVRTPWFNPLIEPLYCVSIEEHNYADYQSFLQMIPSLRGEDGGLNPWLFEKIP